MPDPRSAHAEEGGGRPAIREAQLASHLMRLLQERIARGLGDPRLQGMVSVLGVDLGHQQGEAIVRVSIFPRERARLALAALESAAPRLAQDIRTPLRVRRMPKLRFALTELPAERESDQPPQSQP